MLQLVMNDIKQSRKVESNIRPARTSANIPALVDSTDAEAKSQEVSSSPPSFVNLLSIVLWMTLNGMVLFGVSKTGGHFLGTLVLLLWLPVSLYGAVVIVDRVGVKDS